MLVRLTVPGEHSHRGGAAPIFLKPLLLLASITQCSLWPPNRPAHMPSLAARISCPTHRCLSLLPPLPFEGTFEQPCLPSGDTLLITRMTLGSSAPPRMPHLPFLPLSSSPTP